MRGSRIAFRFRAKHRVLVHTALVDSELAAALKELLGTRGGRTLFRYRRNDELVALSARRLNDYIREHMKNDYVDEDSFWGGIERAQEHARGVVARIREGDIRHDPRGGSCPTWCELWPMCRVKRS